MQSAEEKREYQAKYYREHREKKIAQISANQKRQRPMRREYEKAHYARVRVEVFEYYGLSCACCGETEIAFLTIDHVNGGGNTHRRQIFKGGHGPFYPWLKARGFPEGYQTLCQNCNTAKHKLGECPHKRLAESAETTDRPGNGVIKQQIVGGYGRISENWLYRGEFAVSEEA